MLCPFPDMVYLIRLCVDEDSVRIILFFIILEQATWLKSLYGSGKVLLCGER